MRMTVFAVYGLESVATPTASRPRITETSSEQFGGSR